MTTAVDISPERCEAVAWDLTQSGTRFEEADLVRALRAALTARDWQPIATAPHMRKIIVHYLNQLGKHRTVMACYYEKNSLEMHDDYAEVGTYDAEKDGYFADEGWYEEHDSEDPIMKLQGEPDHWMPLPEPPK